jgi:hypothetical protein
MRNSCFELQGDNLIVYNGDAYIYDSKNGSFLGIENEENLDLNYNWEEEYDEQYIEGNYYYDSFQVYKALADGTLEVIINRPWWHNIFSFGMCLCIAFVGAAGTGISIFLEKRQKYNIVKSTVVFKNRKAKILNNYFKTTSIVHLIYTLLNVIFAFVTSWLIVGIIPLALHMIVSSIILWNMKDRLSWNTGETHVVDFWWAAEIGSFVIAFLSVIVASAIAG